MKNYSTLKISILLLIVTFCSKDGHSQIQLGPDFSNDKNYVVTYIPRIPISDDDSVKAGFHPYVTANIKYVDGLGRESQIISYKQNPEGKDVIHPIEYDGFGRKKKSYLSYSVTGNASFRENYKAEQINFYQNEYGDEGNYAFSYNVFDNSPLNRVVRQVGPGRSWHPETGQIGFNGRGSDFMYETNSAGEVKKYRVNYSTGDLELDGYYPEGTLRKNTVIDEDGRKTIEWSDFPGNKIKIAVGKDSLMAVTYYVYDDFGLLRWVLPPKAVALSDLPSILSPSNSFAKKLCYYYQYDNRKRNIVKQIPGAQPVYYVYDIRDRLVMSQDGEQRAKYTPEWTIYKYDDFNRMIFTAIFANNQYPDYWRNIFNANQGQILYSMDDYYVVVSENSWDSYPTSWATGWNFTAKPEWTGYPATASDRTLGLLTASRERIIDSNGGPGAWLNSKFFYDEKGRLIQSYTKTDSKSSYMKSYFLIAWNGDLIKKLDHHVYDSNIFEIRGSRYETSLLENYEYDHASRLISKTIQIFNNEDTLSYQVNQVYDSMGRLVNSEIDHSTLSVISNSFDYNIRNWVTNINYNINGNNLYNLNLGYEKNVAYPQYSGNIASAQWQTLDQEVKKYEYGYDELNRIIQADFTPSDNFSTSYQYDLNGNLLNLTRRGFSKLTLDTILLDDLSYTYLNDGNQLSWINNEAEDGHGGFINFEPDPDSMVRYYSLYSYDRNGNMRRDYRRDLSVYYNFLNLPIRIDNMVSGESILYTYTSSGQKLSQELETADGGVGVLRQYAGPFVYINNELAWINTAEGRITNPSFGQLPVSSPSFKAEFHLRDHLGNTRLVMEDVNGFFYYNIQQADYYPFGMQQHRAYMTPKTATSTNLLTNRYLYNGKEMQDDMELGWYDYGARFYDAQVARFHNVDPLGETYSYQSNYVYAINNPVVFIDYMGLGPKDRVRIAHHLLSLNPKYKQEHNFKMRTGTEAAALEFMDCSEFVSRVLAGDGITEKIEHRNSKKLVDFFSGELFEKNTDDPEVGDIVAWGGHVGLVESFDPKTKEIMFLHMTSWEGYTGPERKAYSLSYFDKKGAGFYRPKNETPDILDKTFQGKPLEEATVTESNLNDPIQMIKGWIQENPDIKVIIR